jgi:hypothetical protein
LEIGLATIRKFVSCIFTYQAALGLAVAVVVAVGTTFLICAFSKFPYEEKPLSSLWRSLFGSKKKGA